MFVACVGSTPIFLDDVILLVSQSPKFCRVSQGIVRLLLPGGQLFPQATLHRGSFGCARKVLELIGVVPAAKWTLERVA